MAQVSYSKTENSLNYIKSPSFSVLTRISMDHILKMYFRCSCYECCLTRVCVESVCLCVAFYILFIFDHALFCCYFYRYMYRRVDTLDTHSISHTLSGIPHISFIYIRIHSRSTCGQNNIDSEAHGFVVVIFGYHFSDFIIETIHSI